jgi:DNA polymerase III sliding clamp (beta) subunit (PCNA family)
MLKSTLLEVLRHLRPAQVGTKDLPVLHTVRVTRNAAGWHFARTDLTLFLSVTVREAAPVGALAEKLAAVRAKREAIDILLPYYTLTECAKAADKETDIEFLPDPAKHMHSIRIQISGAACTIPAASQPANEFPDEPAYFEFPGEGAKSLAVSTITEAHARVFETCQSCISTDETRYVLNGALWANQPDKTSAIVTTDGRRLYCAEGLPPAPADSAIIPTIVVPLIRAGMQVSAFVDTCAPGTPEESTTAARLIFSHKIGSLIVRIHARTVEGNYPNFRQVIPTESLFTVRFDREQVAKSLSTMDRIVGADRSGSFRMAVGKGCVTFSMNKPEVGVAKTICPAIVSARTKDKPFSIAFNPDYFLDALGMGFDTIAFIDELSPGVLLHPRRPREKYVLMPMRVTA